MIKESLSLYETSIQQTGSVKHIQPGVGKLFLWATYVSVAHSSFFFLTMFFKM